MSDTPATPSPNPMNSALTRSAWLVNALTLCVLGIFLFVNAYFRGKSDEDYVVNGVSVAALLAFHGWSLVLCVRALRKKTRFWQCIFALAAALLLLSVSVLKFSFFSTSVAGVATDFCIACRLAVLVPVFSVAIVLAVLIARLVSRWPINRFVLYASSAAIFLITVAILLPLPLFIFEARYARNDESYAPFRTPVQRWCYSYITNAPEFISEPAAWLMQDHTLTYARILLTGSPSENRLATETLSSRPGIAESALAGLLKKNPVAAKAAAMRMFIGNSRTSSHVELLSSLLNDEEWIQALQDERVNTRTRYVLSEGYIYDRLNRSSELTVLLLKSPGAVRGNYSISRFFKKKHANEVFQSIWQGMIQETNKTNVVENVSFLGQSPKELQLQMIQDCLTRGTDEMKCELLNRLNRGEGDIEMSPKGSAWMQKWTLETLSAYANDPNRTQSNLIRATVKSARHLCNIAHPVTADAMERLLLNGQVTEIQYKTMAGQVCDQLKAKLKE